MTPDGLTEGMLALASAMLLAPVGAGRRAAAARGTASLPRAPTVPAVSTKAPIRYSSTSTRVCLLYRPMRCRDDEFLRGMQEYKVTLDKM